MQANVKQRKPTKLFVWVGLFWSLTGINIGLTAVLTRNRHIGGYIEIALLAALFSILVFRPSDAQEFERRVDVEAATATLGFTFWTALTWDFVADSFHMSRHVSGEGVALFIFVTYIAAKVIVELRYR